MSRKHSLITALSIIALFAATLPVLAAAKRGRPMGAYRYNGVGTNTFRGQSESLRDRGRLTLSGRRVVGSTNSGNVTFTLRTASRIASRVPVQSVQAQGKWTNNDSRFGLNRGPITANIRVQKTRVGTWKLSGNYVGRITRGRAKGAVQTGRITARSI